MTQAEHLASLHPRLRAAYARALAEYVRLYPGRTVPRVISSHRPQLDCARVAGACSGASKHSRYPAEAVDVDAGADWSKSTDPHGYAADFARLVQAADPCIEWGGRYRQRDVPHFELQMDRAGCSRLPLRSPSGGPASAATWGLALSAAVLLLLVTR